MQCIANPCLSYAKGDPTDSELARDVLIIHGDKLSACGILGVRMRTIQRPVEQRRALIGDTVPITNRLTDSLKQYFPTSARL